MIKIILFLYRGWNITHDDFAKYWTEKHAPLVKELLGDKLLKYTTNVALKGNYRGWFPDEAPPCDGVAELWLDLEPEGVEEFFSSCKEALMEDERYFVDSYTWFFVNEIPQLDRLSGA